MKSLAITALIVGVATRFVARGDWRAGFLHQGRLLR